MEEYDDTQQSRNDDIEQSRNETGRRSTARVPVLTVALIVINALVWGAITLYSLKSGKSYNQLLFDFGAKDNASIISGQFWRLFTPIFLHANIVHLAVNCYSLYVVGITVENLFGKFKFAVIYFIAGIIGNIASFAFSSGMGVGASGAIFGLLGALLYFGLEEPKLFKAYLGYNVVVMIVVNLGYGFSQSGIDNFAHIGGLIGGFTASGVVMLPYRRGSRWYLNRYLYIILTFIIATSGLYYGFNNRQSKIISLEKTMEELDKAEKWSEAEKAGEQVLALNPSNRRDSANVLWSLIRIEAMQGKYDESIEHANELVRIEPDIGHFRLGEIYYNMGQYDKARQEFEVAKRLNVPYDVDELLRDIERKQNGS